MFKTSKKIFLSITMCSLLITTNVNCASLWDNDAIFKNVTEMSVATDPMSGATYLSGGGIEVRFKRTGNFPPIFSAGSPGLKASCRGISFDAGYAMFMNLERLGQQLSQAGASVAYGVLIGLVYTLPGVEQAFSKLNEWSQWLQGFLNDSCNIGQNFGRSMGGTVWKDLEGVTNDINGSIASPSEYLDNHPDTAKFMKKIYSSGTASQQKEANSQTVEHVIMDAKGSMIATYLNTLIKKGEENISFPTTNVAAVQNLDSSGFKQSTLMMSYFISAIMSNIAINEVGFNNALTSINGKSAEKIASFLEEINNDKSYRSMLARNNVSTEALINLMLNGTKVNENYFKGLRIVLINLDQGKGSKEQYVILTDQTTGATSTAFDGFEGYIGESKKLVFYTYNEMIRKLKNPSAVNSITLSSIKVSAAYPNMSKILKNLVLYYGKDETHTVDDTTDPEITDILNYIAYSNAINLTTVAIDNLNLVAMSSTSENSNKSAVAGYASPETAATTTYKISVEDVRKQRELFSTKVKEMKKNLIEISESVEKSSKVREINEKLEKAIKEKNFKGVK